MIEGSFSRTFWVENVSHSGSCGPPRSCGGVFSVWRGLSAVGGPFFLELDLTRGVKNSLEVVFGAQNRFRGARNVLELWVSCGGATK